MLFQKMRENLSDAADKVEEQLGDKSLDVQQVKGISKYVANITSKVPVIRNLEKRLDIMQGLDPLMDGILERMQEVTDNSYIRQLQMQ